MQGLYDLNPKAAGEFLDAETAGGMQGMREMLLLCPDRPVRVAMCGFYIHLLGILAEGEGDRWARKETYLLNGTLIPIDGILRHSPRF